MQSNGLEEFLRGREIKECLAYVLDKVEKDPSMIEDDLYRVLENSGLFKKLGYLEIGVDIRPQRPISGERKKPDYAFRDEYQNTIFVMEVKRPLDKELEKALPQLWERYVLPLKSKYGVLTNGKQIVIYERIGINHKLVMKVNLVEATEVRCNQIQSLLKKPHYNIGNIQGIRECLFATEKLSLKTDIAKEDFFETFGLKENTIFGSLVHILMDLFDEIYPKSKFLEGAYGFWNKSLARKPEKVPDSWKNFLKKDEDIFKFMFCLESAHAMLARLMLAKACEDLRFPSISISDFVSQRIHCFRGQVPICGYPIVLIELFAEMRNLLVYSIFEEDIFSWWIDAFAEMSRKPSGELIQERLSNALENFSEIIARLILVLYKFDFSEVAGDPLGELYQQYFDRETRKALGEFYTPIEVVDYILDAVEYNVGHGITSKRLLDPACGSGTFLVEALKRYFKEAEMVAKKKGWANILREFCNSPYIVGLDIHPFACLMAQIRVMLEIIPYYKKAIEEEQRKAFFLPRLPIFRTDSLLIEFSPQETESLQFSVTLPIKANAEKSVIVNVMMPSWRKIQFETHDINNLDEYFRCIFAWFDIVKEHVRSERREMNTDILKTHLMIYLEHKDFQSLANFLKPYGDDMLDEVKRLRSAFGDGRLVKSIEDAVLAALLKNYLLYDFVVGNPPYVRIQNLTDDQRSYLKKSYKSAVGKFDISIIFLERGINWLSEKGRFGLIISNRFIQRGYGKQIRKYISEISTIKQCVDFGDTGAFKDVTNYPCIFAIEKSRDKILLRYVRVKEPKENILDHIRKHLYQEEYSDEFIDIYETTQPSPNEKIWKLFPKEEGKIFEKIKGKASHFLGDVSERIAEGIKTGADTIFVVTKGTIEKHNLEKTVLKHVLRGEFVRRWKIIWKDLYLIYPYVRQKNVDVPIELEKYPNLVNYLIQHKRTLENRKYYGKTILETGKKFYELWNPDSALYDVEEKIITPNVSNESNFTYDKEGFYGLGSVFVIILRDKFKKHYLYVLGLLNSKTLDFYLRHISPFVQARYYMYDTQYLEQLPIKLPRTDKEKHIADQIVKKVATLLQRSAPERLIKGFPSTYLPKYRSKSVEFDEVKCTFNADHGRLEPSLSGTVVKGYVVYPARGEDPIWVETEEKARYLMLALKGKSVKQGVTIKVLIPRNNSLVQNILKRFEDTIKEIESVDIEQLEKEIDELVYQLYGLNEQDIKIVEKFLEKFLV